MADVTVHLYRSCKSSKWKGADAAKKEASFNAAHGRGSLYPDYTGFTRKDGTVRAPDVTSFKDKVGQSWVRGVEDRDDRDRAFVSHKEGVSVSTSLGSFGYEGWFYFLLPEGTPIPASLDVLATPSRNDAGHFSIRCRNLMQREAYEGALDTLARAALARAIELGKQSLHMS